MKYIDNLSDEGRKLIESCEKFGVELCDWQQNWINRWIAAGRPKGLYAQYTLMTPIVDMRRDPTPNPQHWFN